MIKNDNNIEIVGISVDDQKRSAHFKKKLNLCFDLLTDVDGKIMHAYDVVDPALRNEIEIALSADIVINQNGEIIYFHKGHYSERPSVEEVLAAIK